MHLYLYSFNVYLSLIQCFVMEEITSKITSMFSLKGIAVEVLMYYVISLIKLSVIIVGYKLLVYGTQMRNHKDDEETLRLVSLTMRVFLLVFWQNQYIW